MKDIGKLYPKAPYNFRLLLDLLGRYQHPSTDIIHDGAYWRVLPAGDELALLRVDEQGDIDSPQLAVSLVKAGGNVDDESILEQMKYILGGDSDLSAFYDYAQNDAILWSVVEPLVGLCWIRTPTVFEALVTTVIEQQIAWTAAQKAQKWLVQWTDNRLSYDGMDFYAFPTEQQIADATIEDLTPLKITFRRMGVMIDIARQVVGGNLDLEGLRNHTADEAYKSLTAIKGIGHWTAAWAIQRAMGWHNFVGHNDVALQAAVNRYFYGGEGKIPEQKMQETFARYGQYAGMAAHYTILRLVLDKY